MKFGPLPVEQSEGKILAHNVPRPDGRTALRKGKLITRRDVATLREEGYAWVYAVELESGDVEENEAACRVAEAAGGSGLRPKGSSSGRVSLEALFKGVLRVDAERLERVNRFDGLAFATLPSFTIVEAGQTAATVKIIPYALPASVLEQAERAARGDSPLAQVRELKPRRVGLVFSGLPFARERVARTFGPPLRRRIESWGSRVAAQEYVELAGEKDGTALAEALARQVAEGAELIVLASETSIMDANDIAPRAVLRAGGQVACVGAPVDPGNLLMLAYLEGVPVLGVPGCARSPKPNVIDRVLPALLAGDPLSAADIRRLGYSGLLAEDAPRAQVRVSARVPSAARAIDLR